MAGDINTNTVDGMLAYCDYLIERGYARTSQVEPWKIAIRKVFSTVEGSGEFGTIKLDELDAEDYMGRFEVKARGTLKHESLTAYVRRVRNAMDAYAHFLREGRPPTFRQVTTRNKSEETSQTAQRTATTTATEPEKEPSGMGMLDHVFPLRSGQVARLRLPQRLEKDDTERLIMFLRALQFEPQGQLPERTSEAAA